MSRFNDRANEQLTLLYRRYSGWLKRVVGHRFAGDDAEEIVQKTYLRISRLVREDVVVHPRALLLRVARNTAIDRARRSGRGVLAARVDPDDERELFERSR
jgi:RNA polymerase sigma-70 factor (ECF subfamily)